MSLYAHPYVRQSGSSFGYAYSYYEIERHLREYTHNGEKLQVDLNSPKSKVQLYYGTPPGFFYPHQYKINMTQWESTLVPNDWVHHATRCDEWWTANQFGADAFINSGVPAEKVHVYEHGVDKNVWTPKKRGQNKKVRFLHVDSGSPRKRADLAIKAFKAAFGNNPDYELTLKHSHHPSKNLDWTKKETLENAGDWESRNIRHIKENLTLEELVSIFHFHDVLVYPSEGEGFGLIPLQALATGMPVISTGRWCSYEKYFNGNTIESTLGISPIEETYNRYGDVVLPELDSIVHLMKKAAEDIESEATLFYNQIDRVTAEYDWQHRTNLVMDKLVNRLNPSMFESSKIYAGSKEIKTYATDKKKVLVYTLFRNCEKFVDLYYSQLTSLVESFPDVEFYFSGYENDSSDSTKEKLNSKDWSFFKDYSLITENIGTKSFGSVAAEERVKNLSNARNKAIEAGNFLDKVDYVMMIESDVKYEMKDVEKILNFGQKEEFDIVSGITYYLEPNRVVLYDSWATRRRDALEFGKVNNGGAWLDIDENWTKKPYDKYTSTSNGICLYKAKPFVEGVRHGYISRYTNKFDCEMAVLCERFIDKGYDKIFIVHDARIGHIGHGEAV